VLQVVTDVHWHVRAELAS